MKMTLRPDLMATLERSVGTDRALAVAAVDDLQVGIYDVEDEVAVGRHSDDEWIDLARYETFWNAMRYIGSEVDRRWDTVPVEVADNPTPVIVLPGAASYSALFRTVDGVRLANESNSRPGHLHVHDDQGRSFRHAIEELAEEAEILG